MLEDCSHRSMLFQLRCAIGAFGPFSGFVQCREQHSGEDGDDGNHNQKFDKCKFFHVDPCLLKVDGLFQRSNAVAFNETGRLQMVDRAVERFSANLGEHQFRDVLDVIGQIESDRGEPGACPA